MTRVLSRPAQARRLTPNFLRSRVSDGQGSEQPEPKLVGELRRIVGAPPQLYTGRQLLDACRRSEGWPYDTAPGRVDPNSGFTDCSGMEVQGFRRLGIYPGGTTSTSLELWAINNGGRYVSREYAINHAGCGLAIWGYGAQGHIGISVGDGRQHYGTPRRSCGLPRSVGFAPFDCFRWGEYFTWPYINHEGPVGPDPEPPPMQQLLEDDTMWIYKIKDPGSGPQFWAKDGDVVVPITGDAWAELYAQVGKGVNVCNLTNAQHFAIWDQSAESRLGRTKDEMKK